ncbi:MAG: HAMP domain-containing histidine kinase [Ruminococcaceae bacterium]|nr:HAMP domain-containing histidine kinase [Oscillospiraceae bacterium]
MFKSVYAKYISTFMLIIFVSFLILVLIVTGMVNNYASNTKEEVLNHAAAGAAEFLEARTSSGLKTDFGQMIDNVSDDVDRMLRTLAAMDDDVTILLVDNADGSVIRMVTPSGETASSEAVIPRHIILEVNAGNSAGRLESLAGVFDTDHFFRTAPVYTDDGYACGTVFACSSTRTQDELLGVMIKTILIASLWVMLAALVAVYLLTERVIGPLKDMSRMAKQFAAGNYEARVRVRGNDEVSQLARAFNNMAESISRLELMRNTFVANVSHDLRTPMTTISGFIDNILSGAIPEEKRGYYLELIRTEVQRLARLVTSLLDISRIQAGDRKFDHRPFDICEMARRILISFEAKIEAKHLDVEFICDEERMTVLADYDAIYQILYNLCDNAVKFSKEGGKLSVSLRFTEEQRAVISVYNEGEGIAKDDLPFVFERFYKGDKSRGLDKSGAGLGLFIAKTIMDAHHERIWVESEQGRYCCFKFILPLV